MASLSPRRLWPSRPQLQRLPAVLLALALGAAGGAAADALTLPLPWMIGSMLATTVAAVAGAPIAMAAPLRSVMVVILGVMLGSGFTPEILEAISTWGLSLAAVLPYILISTTVGYLYFRRRCGYDPVTAYFSAAPGGLNEMILVGSAMGGDARIISLTHGARILFVVMLIPFAFRVMFELDDAARQSAGLYLGEIAAADYAVLIASGLIGFLAARALRVPAAAVVGPMLVSAAAHLAGLTRAAPPVELVAAAQVAVGAAIGARFAGTELRLILRILLRAAGSTALLIVVTGAFALVLHLALGIELTAVVLAFSPGGLAEMSLMAIALQVEAAYVAIHHIVRIALIVVLAPLAFRLLRRRSGASE